MDENPLENSKPEDTVPQKSDSLLSKLKINFSFPPFIQTFVIPGLVILIVLLVGGGGTYLVVSNILGTSTQGSASQKVSSTDVPVIPSLVASPPSPTPQATVTPDLSAQPAATPSPTSSVTQTWPSYTFTAVSMTFSYPVGWMINLGATSGAPYLYTQDFSGAVNQSAFNMGQYAIYVSRLQQVGITTTSALVTQLAQNAVGNNYINGVNFGTLTLNSSTNTTVNGYQAVKQNVTFSGFPNTTFSQTYILDGKGNVVEFMPMLDANYGQPYFNLILTTVKFTN